MPATALSILSLQLHTKAGRKKLNLSCSILRKNQEKSFFWNPPTPSPSAPADLPCISLARTESHANLNINHCQIGMELPYCLRSCFIAWDLYIAITYLCQGKGDEYQKDVYNMVDFRLSLKDQDVTLFIFSLSENSLISGSVLLCPRMTTEVALARSQGSYYSIGYWILYKLAKLLTRVQSACVLWTKSDEKRCPYIQRDFTGNGSASWKVYFNGYHLKAGWAGKLPRCIFIHTQTHTPTHSEAHRA